jgi:hypothetical protein
MMCWPAIDAGLPGKFRSRAVRSALNYVPARETRSSAHPARCRLGGKFRVRYGVLLVSSTFASRCWEPNGDFSAPPAKRASRRTGFLCWIWFSGLLLLFVSGCQKPEEIVSYTVARLPAREAKPDVAEQALSADDERSLPFTAEIPEGWTALKAGPMQTALYTVRDGDRKLAVSVSTAGGDLSTNVNRWRDQVHLDSLPEAELGRAMRKITVDGNEAIAVEFVGTDDKKQPETILGVIVEARGRQWFIKLKGDADLAAREKEHFDEFVQSIRFR